MENEPKKIVIKDNKLFQLIRKHSESKQERAEQIRKDFQNGDHVFSK